MPFSDSDDFESADEGQTNSTKKDRKKRNSSSNYSDNLDSEMVTCKTPTQVKSSEINTSENIVTDGWDDFEIEESETAKRNKNFEVESKGNKLRNEPNESKMESSQDTGWDEFDDWGQSETLKTQEIPHKPTQNPPDADIQAVTERLAATSTKSDGWGWGWGVDTLLSTATTGITSLTNQVSQGISTVLESSIGAPDPEEFARQTVKDSDAKTSDTERTDPEVKSEVTSNDIGFPFGSLLSGVTKFVETTGTKVITGGLDTLETIGKKTMEVLQDGDPGLARKRAILGLDSGDKPVLSQILREAKDKADEEDKIKEAKREAKEVHYESLFDDFEGLVHLEALEMLSRQVNMRIEERLRSSEPDKRQDIKETLQQIAELCEMPEDDDADDDNEEPSDMSKEDILHEKLQRATRDIGLKMQFQPLIKQYTATLAWLDTPTVSERALYKRGVSSLACSTAQCVQLYHKTCEMLLVKPRRSTADEADALAQLTVVLTKHVSELATLFTEKLSEQATEDKGLINDYITNIFLEAGNSSKYIENAFQLTLPIIQIGAV